ncbi:hypothetical protein PPL_04380 [Heterostelium album PN500]|uniref:Uncharacterized protein n=1 Tax=Heterostelium pallidum (strain ATCC 26659 / Pp 5 / PN500) TaxID=670386 RepID=D3B7E3_HETP5|nr:hypothetical protein PPL_04380 [Heterostelium album PN500]EFA82686.1 hypothetical protein PPL_04380 [Heterostelium album PN500]|eukprot:XP_020434803.1 hypothetical protein PPL_04380 [Heterostelium album PN500]
MSEDHYIHSDKDLRVPPFFPAVTSECKEVAAKFFICIEKSTIPLNEQDKDAPRRGLVLCEKELNAYTQCMLKYQQK